MAMMVPGRKQPRTVVSTGLTWLSSCFSQLSSVFCGSSPVFAPFPVPLPVPHTLLPRVLWGSHGHVELDSVLALVLSSPYYSLGIWASHKWRLTG